MRQIFKTLTCAAALVTAAVTANATELKLGLITPPGHVWSKAADKFAETLAAKSNGDLTVMVFPGGQLGNEPEMFQQIQAGLLDMGLMTGALTSLREPTMAAWFTPFLFKDVKQAAAAAKTPAAQEMLGNLDKIGLKGLGYSFAGMRHILMSKSAIGSIDDLQGKKIRIVPFPAMKEWWSAVGAVPTPVQLPDVYQALQNGLLDGVDIDLDALVGSKFQEVAHNLTLTSHMAFPAVAMMGKSRWSQLTPEQQAMVAEAMTETLEWANASQMDAEDRNLATLKAAIDVRALDDAQTVFAKANAAFDKAFGDNDLVKAFRAQVAAQMTARN